MIRILKLSLTQLFRQKQSYCDFTENSIDGNRKFADVYGVVE